MSVIDGNTLDGVSATTLWTLSNRGTEAKRSDGVIRDPWAVALLDAIDFDYRKFGRPNQAHALRAHTFDIETHDYLSTHPKAAVVALAEGLQTSFWRLDQAGVADELTWYSVDLPPVMAIRESLLPYDDRIVALAQSALDRSWMDRVDATDDVFITAEGLLMYLEPEDVRSLITDCAARFPGGRMIFDSIPHWASRRTIKGLHLSKSYIAPPMPFALTADEGLAMAGTGPGAIPGVRSARDVAMSPGRGLFKLAAQPWVDRIGPLHRARPSITVLDFG
ncbi:MULTISPECIES: class I SAM-dependent methyltransferase [unclassified Mycolicibacterium]|uniref:class I SAM-dependent methyltransferase n=1 Tax=unclassified Mycolicibacterium TaxID=2636767 RepID=UPI0012DDF911|nr:MULTISPECIES: class I SAM-dependent methyltransferase [unclassified Mycolicibacterium]MUL85059.1 class I SAM-dependent methyltransferase [Mycolicibacterium sp. CBMA 329]MUL91026.1 class I SAM-dependent methyltransferase [Mycolicibacterium sp. CBMA 331]MUL98303.1 class I SAM-dependent methyltransferase [Mycolicibacterium sp. CBMA 334]MUM29088.1 class I SAM-dependent methyltransferase [Mycolicibacterium sp. CBMA 295]MUM40785.1 class I SAM-dependent methyltransferase [Mycolicibacterium sp. CBM